MSYDIPHMTFVYFAKGNKSGLIKIGYSADPDKRCATFGDKNDQGETAKVLFAIRGGPAEERTFHDRFRKYRVRGEWFVNEGLLKLFIRDGKKNSKKWREQVRQSVSNKSEPLVLQRFVFEGPPPEPVPYVFGYARVSTADQSLDMQVTALKAVPCTRIFTDKLTGKTAHRPEFRLMLKHLQPGDTVAVYSLSRLFRNTKQLLDLFDDFTAKNITLKSITENLNIRTSSGRMAATILAAVDENEVGRVRERTIDGMAERKRQGAVFGRPRVVTPDQVKEMKKLRGKMSVALIARRFDCSPATVYNNT